MGKYVVVSVDRKEIFTYPLSEVEHSTLNSTFELSDIKSDFALKVGMHLGNIVLDKVKELQAHGNLGLIHLNVVLLEIDIKEL